MKVLLIDVNCKYTSTGKIVYDLYQYINTNGDVGAICYGRGPLIKEPNIYKFSSDFETFTHAFLTRITGLTGIFSPFSTKKLINYINFFKPDLVHIHELHGYYVNIIPIINCLINYNIKTVWTFHCEFMYTGKCGHSYDCEKWKIECHKCPRLREYPASLYLDFTRKMFNNKKSVLIDFKNLIIVTPSQWLADRVKQSFLKDKVITVIHNGIDSENLFYPQSFSHLKIKHNLQDEKIILAVGPDLFSENKGGKWVLKLAKMFKGRNVKFILIGVTNPGQKVDENVIAIEKTSNQQQLAQYYSMADIFVICSQKETFSLTCAESLCCGTPVAGFKSGAPETIFIPPFAHFVEYGDLDSLMNYILRSFNESLSQKEISEYGKKYFDKKVMLEQYYHLYTNMVKDEEN